MRCKHHDFPVPVFGNEIENFSLSFSESGTENLLSKICSRKYVPGSLFSEFRENQKLSLHLSLFQFFSRFFLLKAFTAATELNQHKVENITNSLSLSRRSASVHVSVFVFAINKSSCLSVTDLTLR